MEKFACNLEEMLKQKLCFYRELVSVMDEERGFIVKMDIESLWDACAKKRKITLNIEKLRKEILHLVRKVSVGADMDTGRFSVVQIIKQLPVPVKIKSRLGKLVIDINGKKDELQRVASENRTYVKEYLGVISDLMSTITGCSSDENYSSAGVAHTQVRPNRLINAEV